jgi:hypothetical protein
MLAARLSAWLSGVWTGLLLAIAGVAAPTAFAVLERAQAGLVARRLFAIEGQASVVFAVVVFLLERSVARRAASEHRGSLFSPNMLLALGALFCTVAGHHALQPMLEAARSGQGALSFGALHMISSGFYATKLALVMVLAWRAAAR